MTNYSYMCYTIVYFWGRTVVLKAVVPVLEEVVLVLGVAKITRDSEVQLRITSNFHLKI